VPSMTDGQRIHSMLKGMSWAGSSSSVVTALGNGNEFSIFGQASGVTTLNTRPSADKVVHGGPACRGLVQQNCCD
jgi:hypothetical protein